MTLCSTAQQQHPLYALRVQPGALHPHTSQYLPVLLRLPRHPSTLHSESVAGVAGTDGTTAIWVAILATVGAVGGVGATGKGTATPAVPSFPTSEDTPLRSRCRSRRFAALDSCEPRPFTPRVSAPAHAANCSPCLPCFCRLAPSGRVPVRSPSLRIPLRFLLSRGASLSPVDFTTSPHFLSSHGPFLSTISTTETSGKGTTVSGWRKP